MPRKTSSNVPPPLPPKMRGGNKSFGSSMKVMPSGGSSGKPMMMAAAASVAGGSYTTNGTSTLVALVVVILGLIGLIYYLIGLNYRAGVGGGGENRGNGQILTESSASMIPNVLMVPQMNVGMGPKDPFNDPYAPPLKNDGMYFPPDSTDTRGIPLIYPNGNNGGPSTCNSGACAGAVNMRVPVGVPVNMQTRGYSPDYSQIGILTRERDNKTEDTSFRDNVILPLFGRRVMNGRDKYQYYTMSNTGAVNTKLPVKIRGRNCINEYGCDEVTNNDAVYVDGYNQSFHATVYENSQFSYIPFL